MENLAQEIVMKTGHIGMSMSATKNWGSGFQLQTYGGTGLTKTKLEK
jgi:hypothetical protein